MPLLIVRKGWGGDMLSTTAVVQLVDVVNFDVYSLVRL